MKATISAHNRKVLSTREQHSGVMCKCPGGLESCPVEGRCETDDTLYKADVNTVNGTKVYIGATQDTFKQRWTSHKSNCRLPAYDGATKLSTHVWNLKRRQIAFSLKWKLMGRARSYNPEAKRCNLCTAEKTAIMYYTEDNMVNTRSEIMNKCRHRNKFTLDKLV